MSEKSGKEKRVIDIEKSVGFLPGVGKVREEKLNKLGIYTVKDLLYHFPRAYQNRSDIMSIANAKKFGDNCAMLLTIGSEPGCVRLNGGRNMTKFSAFDESGKITIIFFNQDYIRNVFKLGSAYRFWGKIVKDKRGVYSLTSPDYEIFSDKYILPDFYPVYPLSSGLTQKFLINLIGIVLSDIADQPDPIPEKIRIENSLPSLSEALRAIHRPKDYDELNRARKRFIFEELYIYGLSIASMKRLRQSSPKKEIEKTDIRPLLSKLDFELTDAQKRCVNEIYSDMVKEKYPMTRLLSGDVGSGKTVCAECAAYIALKNGYQVCIMAPTEILARQHFAEMEPLFSALGFKAALLVGSLTAGEKRKTRAAIASGDIRLVVGTHALITDDTLFENIGLVITDEQHRFGVAQRSKLSSSDIGVHSLAMTATPIPRSLSLILYGDLSLSMIDRLPPGRQKIDTYVIGDNKRGDMYEFIAGQIRKGRQVYVVCPKIEPASQDESGNLIDFSYKPGDIGDDRITSAFECYQLLKESVFPDLRIGLLHGRMKEKEKDAVMSKFASGNMDILVSTTVIEVGVNVPNASVMVVENAERFGLAQLHQLRGRVGRGAYKSYCLLMSDAKPDSPARERLSVLKNSANGFEIAEYDLKVRGPGDIISSGRGIRQHGESKLGLSALCDNVEILSSAFASAEQTVSEDPNLEKEENAISGMFVRELFEINKNTVN